MEQGYGVESVCTAAQRTVGRSIALTRVEQFETTHLRPPFCACAMPSASTFTPTTAFISTSPLILQKRSARTRFLGVRVRRARARHPNCPVVRPRAVLRQRQENGSESDFGYAPDHPLGVDLRDEEVKNLNPSAAGTADEKAGSAASANAGTGAAVQLQQQQHQQSGVNSGESATKQNEVDIRQDGGNKEIRIGVAVGPGQKSSASTSADSSGGTSLGAMKETVIGLVKESTMTGHLRLPTGKEAVLFAWESSIVIALIILLRAGVQSTLKWIHAKLSSRRKDEVTYEESVWECMQRPLESVSVFTVATLIAEAVSRPLAAEGLLRYLRTLRELGFIVCAAWFLLRWIERIRIRYNGDKRADKAQIDATSRIATVATAVVTVLVSLDTVGINVQTVLAFGGVGGVAIGFAGREIISNFFGGFMIYVTRPFTVGEWVRSIEEQELNGTVEDVGWYYTRVRTWDKRPLYIPNSRFSTLIVENGSRMSNRRILHTLNLRLEDVPVLPKIVAELTKFLMVHSELDPRQHRMAYVDGFGAYSVQVWLSCYTKSVFLYDFRRVQQEILLEAHEIIRSHGARLATLTTRDVRPGVDIDRYGPYGTNASYRTPSNEPKVGETPPPPRFKLADIPGAPFFSQMHVDDNLLNIESGVSEESLAAALRMESPYPLPKEQKTNETVAQAPVKPPVHAKQSSEAAIAATAAALAATRRNQARIEEQNARTRAKSDATTPKMNISTAPKTAETQQSDMNKSQDPQSSRTMNIMAALPSNDGSSPPSPGTDTNHGTAAKSTASKSTTNASESGKSNVSSSASSATETAVVHDSSSKRGSNNRKTGQVSRQSDAVDSDPYLPVDSARTMKITGNPSTATSTKEKKAETNGSGNTSTTATKSEPAEKNNTESTLPTPATGTVTSTTGSGSATVSQKNTTLRTTDSNTADASISNDAGRTMKISAASDSAATTSSAVLDAWTSDVAGGGGSSVSSGGGEGEDGAKKSRPSENIGSGGRGNSRNMSSTDSNDSKRGS